MCIKGMATPEITYHPSRLTEPLRRKGSKDNFEWESVSWNEVLDEIANKLVLLRYFKNEKPIFSITSVF